MRKYSGLLRYRSVKTSRAPIYAIVCVRKIAFRITANTQTDTRSPSLRRIKFY